MSATSSLFMRPDNPSARQRRGFTLIEVMVVLFFMVVAAAIALPRFANYQKSGAAKDTARNLAGLVREARVLAIQQQRPIALIADPNTHRVELHYDDTLIPQDTTEMAGNTGATTGTVMAAGNTTAESPRPPLYYPEILQIQAQAAQTEEAANSSGGLTFMPDGRVTDADLFVQYNPANAYKVSVRRQGTRVTIEGADPSEVPQGGSR